MFVSVIIAVSIGFIVGVLACVVWPQVFCISCHCKSFTIKKLEQEIAMMNARRVQQIKKKLERLRSKKKG